MATIAVGVDLGQKRDPTAIAVYAIPPEAVRRTLQGSLRLPVEAMAARAARLVSELS
jgi:hypothetical protein